MSPQLLAFLGMFMPVLSAIGTMLYFSMRTGEYKRAIEDSQREVKELKVAQQNYLTEIVGLARNVGNLEGQLERINGRSH